MYQRKRNVRAFTLMELLLVVFIIGVLAAFVVTRFVGVQEDVQVTAAKAQVKHFADALELYKLRMGKFPTTEEGLKALVEKPADPDLEKRWKAAMLDSVPKDPWDKDYIYKCPGDHNTSGFDIISVGPDGQEGTTDDIKNWIEESV